MKLETKYSLKDKVFVMYKNKVLETYIINIDISIHLNSDNTITQKEFYTLDRYPFIVEANRLYTSKEVLIKSL